MVQESGGLRLPRLDEESILRIPLCVCVSLSQCVTWFGVVRCSAAALCHESGFRWGKVREGRDGPRVAVRGAAVGGGQ
eukprot:10745212-Alexandrium_andersonii.AAC.1